MPYHTTHVPYTVIEHEHDDGEDEEPEQPMMMSFGLRDVPALRQSLEKSSSLADALKVMPSIRWKNVLGENIQNY